MLSRRVLIIEDDADAAGVLEAYLRRENYDVVITGDGLSGLDMAHRWKPDLILLDVMLPGLNGTEVLAGLRRKNDVPVIMVTAMGDTPDRIGALRYGADDYVVKPYHPGEVVARVQAVLRRSNQTETKIRSVWARFSPFLWKMPSVTGVMAAILMSRCTTPAGNIASNFAMTARGYPPSSCRKCSTVLAGRSSRVPATPAAAVSVCRLLARFVRPMVAVSARRYLKPADSQSPFCYPGRRLRWKIAALDNTLTKRRIFLD